MFSLLAVVSDFLCFMTLYRLQRLRFLMTLRETRRWQILTAETAADAWSCCCCCCGSGQAPPALAPPPLPPVELIARMSGAKTKAWAVTKHSGWGLSLCQIITSQATSSSSSFPPIIRCASSCRWENARAVLWWHQYIVDLHSASVWPLFFPLDTKRAYCQWPYNNLYTETDNSNYY